MGRSYFTLFTALLFSVQVNAAVVLTSKTKDGEQTSMFQNNTMVTVEHGQTRMIVQQKSNTCTTFNHQSKKYMQMDCKKLMGMFNQMTTGIMDMANAMVPPEMRQSANAQQIPPLDLVKAGSGKYQGYSIDKYQIKIGPDVAMEYWVSKEVLAMVAKEFDYKKFDALFAKNEPTPDGSDPMAMVKAQIDKKEKSLEDKGMILKRISYLEKGPKAPPEVEETHVSTKKFNIKKYMPTKDYKKVSRMQDMM